MTIIEKSKELNAVELYKLTRDARGQNMKNAAGQSLEVSAWIKFSETNERGEEHTVVAIMTTEGDVFRTISAPFIKEFEALLEIFKTTGEALAPITVVEGKTNAGRDFITCALA